MSRHAARMRLLGTASLVLSASCTPAMQPPPAAPVWRAGESLPTQAGPRDLLDLRGLIHAHSAYSHDACDGEPVKDGVRDQSCFDRFRAGVCATRQDYVFLTDHHDSFDVTEFPDALLYRSDDGDALIERDSAPVANRLACDDGSTVLLMAGIEGGMMPVGLEGHAAPAGERQALYDARDEVSLDRLRAQGAVVLLAHPEDFEIPDLLALPIDGFEMFNLHANTFAGMGAALELLLRVNDEDEGLLDPDLFLMPLVSEDPAYLSRWSAALAAGHHPTTTMGTDCHENTFSAIARDGERVDSYRRMMSWMSNHLLVVKDADGGFDDRALKDALRAGRLYGAFEMLGNPIGFDFRVEHDGLVEEMGATVQASTQPHLVVKAPRVDRLDPSREAPRITARLLRATTAGFVEVASAQGDLDVAVTEPGAYRAEIRITPLHLREDLRDDARRLLDHDYVWIYANAVYIE